MKKPVHWTPTAEAELFSQLDYIVEDNPLAAISQNEEIEKNTRLLEDNQEMGRKGRIKGTHELIINNTPFIAIYQIMPDRVEILRFLHGAQQWPPKKKKM